MKIAILCLLFSGSAWAADSVKDLQTAIARAIDHYGLTDDQEVVLSAMNLDPKVSDCADALSAGSPSVAEIPAWLMATARHLFLDGYKLSAEEREQLSKYSPKINFKVMVDGAPRKDLEQLVRTYYFKTKTPLTTGAEGLTVDVTKSSVGKFTVSALITLRYKNQETQELDVRDVSFGSATPQEVIAELIVAAMNSRSLLSDPANLRKEINALSFNLKKLVKLAGDQNKGPVSALAQELDNAYASGFSSLVQSKRRATGKAFITYLSAKRDMLKLARDAERKKIVRDDPAPARQVPARQAPTTPPRKRPKFPWAPTRTRTSVPLTGPTLTSNNSGSDFWATYYWMTDPGYMLTHPWFWGARDKSITGVWMMFDHMTVRSAHNQSDTPFLSQAQQTPDMQRFNNPVDPVFTANPAQPFVDPWSTNPVRPEQVQTLDQSGDRGIDWVDRSTPNPTPTQDSTSSDWKVFGDSAPPPADVQITPTESRDFDNSSGWSTDTSSSSTTNPS